MARGAPKGWNDELCAEHDGSIASFERLGLQLDDLSEYRELIRREKWNLKRAGTITAFALGGAGVALPLALVAAPALAGSLGALGLLGTAGTGTAISTLSGAALTSASLAAIGAGTMAGGMAVIGAAGAALGAVQGGVVTNAYIGALKGFGVDRIQAGESPWVIFIDGFLAEGDTDTRKWQNALGVLYPRSRWYHLRWESKRLADLGKFTNGTAGRAKFAKFVKKFATKASKKAANSLTWPMMVAGALKNPWHVSMVRAAQTGAVLADLIKRTREPVPIVLIGHSLGARVIYYALENLATSPPARVRDVILLGGAVGRDSVGWTSAARAVSGSIVNCYSGNDWVLKVLYQTANAFLSDPVGLEAIAESRGLVRNLDVSGIAEGHNDYKPRLAEVLSRVRPLLGGSS